MRTALSHIEEQRQIFKGTFSHFGSKIYKGHSIPTLLLKNIFSENELLTDHAWFNITKGFEALELKSGDTIEFQARVKKYKKGYVNNRIGINQQQYDYRFSHPTQLKKL